MTQGQKMLDREPQDNSPTLLSSSELLFPPDYKTHSVLFQMPAFHWLCFRYLFGYLSMER
jgi:hypothetical protein